MQAAECTDSLICKLFVITQWAVVQDTLAIHCEKRVHGNHVHGKVKVLGVLICKVLIPTFFKTRARFNLISCFSDQSSHFIAYTLDVS